MLAAEQCSRYRIHGNSLVIRDVAEEDAGKYTVLAQIKEHALYKNLTLTLVVNGEKHRLTSNPSTTAGCVTEQSSKRVRACVCVCVCVCVCAHSESSDRGESRVTAGHTGLSATGEQTNSSLHISRGPTSTRPLAVAPLPTHRPVSSRD